MDSKKIEGIQEMTANVTVGKIYVTAFKDFKTYNEFVEEVAWDTEVWIAEVPEHMIYLEGKGVLEPR